MQYIIRMMMMMRMMMQYIQKPKFLRQGTIVLANPLFIDFTSELGITGSTCLVL